VLNKMKVGIIDLGISNITSVYNAFKKSGFSCCLLDELNHAAEVDLIVLPGVGNFGYLATCFNKSLLKDKILNHHKNKKPIIGICLGMQILFDSSDESPNSEGLGIISGKVKNLKSKINSDCERHIPNIGYNLVSVFKEKKDFLFEKLNDISGYYYFLHSYAVFEKQSNFNIQGITKFCNQEFLAFFLKDNICGIQFHPERSGKQGLFFLESISAHFKKNY
jgi:imidazole glycerol phosphate synthase glutamine amidotransferase subunit